MKILKYTMTGFGVGFIFTAFFMLLFMGANEITTQVFAWLIASGFFGIVSMIFENEKLNLKTQTIIHYLMCLLVATVMMILFYKDYLLSFIISFTLTYLIIYLVMFYIETQKIKEINKKLSGK